MLHAKNSSKFLSFTSRSTAQDQEEIEKKDMAIPNVWALLKKRIIIPHRGENADQLVQALHLEWDSLAPDTVSPYVESMPRRVEAL